jgi:hypothetical protein
MEKPTDLGQPQNDTGAILLRRQNRFSDILHRMKKEESELSSFLTSDQITSCLDLY